MKIRDYRGIEVVLYPRLFDHIRHRHPDMLHILNISDKHGLNAIIRDILENPHEVYRDYEGAYYYIKRLNKIFVTVIVYENIVRTMYLLSNKSYNRMRSKRWVCRIY